MYIVPINYTGNKAKAGNICFDTGRLGIFVCYCDGCHSKVIMSLEEAERFANKLADEKHRPSSRLLGRMLKKRTV